MKTIEVKEDAATVFVSRDDLGFLQSSINETLNALDDKELRIRTGWTRDEADALIEKIKVVREAIRLRNQALNKE